LSESSPSITLQRGRKVFVSLFEEGLREVTVFLFPSSPLNDSDTRQRHPPLSPFAAAEGEEELVSHLEEGLREVTVFLFPSSPSDGV
jgi:hypothetical protein